MLSITIFFNQSGKIRFWPNQAIKSFLGIWMTIAQIKLSGFLIPSLWALQIGGPTQIRDQKMHVFFKNASQNPLLLQHLLCARTVLSFDHHTHLLAPTTPLGITLTHFRECMFTTGGREQWICLAHLTFTTEIWICGFSNLTKYQGFWQRDSLLPTPGGGYTLPEMPQDNP